jgi:sugar phosphate isomerase/epimerase
MRFGVCIGARGKEYIEFIKNAKYDYIEGTFCNVKEMEQSAFEELAKELKANNIFYETFNGYFPKIDGLTVVGEKADFEFLTEYSKAGFERAAALGGKVVVIGSGKSRIIPEGFSREKALEQYAKFLTFCGDLAKGYGMKVVVEPLNRKETNFINTVQECIDLCKFTGHDNVFALADFFHVFMNGEGLEAIENAGKMLQHVHIARGNEDRCHPTEADLEDCKKWSAALRKCGYDDRLTLESRFVPDFETAVIQTRPVLDVFN